MLGIKEIFIEDLREEFVRDFVFPMFRANALYEGVYLLGTSIARPLIAKRLIEIATQTGADAIAHGATGKGNDQVRFELTALRAQPRHQDHRAVARVGLQVAHRPDRVRREAPDPGRQGQARRGAVLGRRQPAALLLRGQGAGGPVRASRRLTSISAPSRPRTRPTRRPTSTIGFAKGDPVAIDGKKLSPAALLTALNELGRDNGIGRVDLVENRFVGMKSRGVYETPGGTILLAAHRAIESLTLDREAAHLKDSLMPRYAELIYYGFWFSPEREMLQALIDKSQEHVEGDGDGSSSTRAMSSSSAAERRNRSTPSSSSPSRTTAAPTTRRTPRASSGSTRCGCACSASASAEAEGRPCGLIRASPICSASSCPSCRRRWRTPPPSTWPSPSPMPAVSARFLAPPSPTTRWRKVSPRSGRAPTGRSISTSSATQPAPPDEARDAAWLKRLAPYYAELGAEMPKLPLKASIVPFTAATCAVVEQLAPAVVSFHFGLPDAAACRARQGSGLQNHQLGHVPARSAISRRARRRRHHRARRRGRRSSRHVHRDRRRHPDRHARLWCMRS